MLMNREMARERDNGIGDALRQARVALEISKAELGRQLKVSGSAISQWESGGPGPSIQKFMEAAPILQISVQNSPFREFFYEKVGTVTADDFFGAQDELVKRAEDRGRQIFGDAFEGNVAPAPEAPQFAQIQGLARDIPVFGVAVGGNDGDFRLNGTEVDRVVRPHGLVNAKGVFALYVVNDSMYPAWREGALFYVNPNRAPAIGDDVVVEMIPIAEGEPGAAFLKRLKARRGDKIIVEQFNPPKEIEFDRGAVRLYRVIPWEEALGLS
jgi:phage repressor protein C with HTH and peptisase S24 domain